MTAGRPLVLSLFPGIGLLDRAFEEEGFTVVRGPDVLWGGDIRTFHPPLGRFDGVIGGPPCQAFSTLANLVRAKGHEPRFGNLIPQFERVVDEAEPRWFLMENVPQAPTPCLDRNGYGLHDFVLCNSHVGAEDGFGQEQERKRRFTFGVLHGEAPDLRQWIQSAALLLPKVSAVLGDARETPVKLGGSGKAKPTRQGSVTAEPVDNSPGAKARQRVGGIDGGHDLPPHQRDKTGQSGRRSLAEMCRLQGLPEDFLEDAPFTMDSKRKAIANGVPLPMGRAIARAVREATR